MLRFSRHLLWLLLLAGLGPAVAQTPIAHPVQAPASSSTAAPPRPIALPVLSVPAAGTQPGRVIVGQDPALQLQVAAQNAQITLQNAQIAALNAKLAATAPTVAWQPYTNRWTDGTHLVFAHYVLSLTLGTVPGNGDNSPAGLNAHRVASYTQEMLEARAIGVSGWAIDSADFSSDQALQCYAAMFQAADALGFKLFLCPDFSNATLESPSGLATIQATLALYAGRPSYFHFQGKPYLSTYAGDGGGTAAVLGVYPAFLANLKAAGLTPYFVPGWPDLSELTAVNADGGWAFPSLSSPLGPLSPLPSLETLAAQVKAAKTSAGVPLTWMQPVTCRTWNHATGQYEDYQGGLGAAVQFDSAFYAQQPDEIEIVTEQDFGDGSGFSSLAAGTTWTGLFNYNVTGFWPTQAGFQRELSYYDQRYETGVTPIIGTDTLIVYNSTQFVAGSSATGYFTSFLSHSGFVRVSGIGPQQSVFEPAGVSHGSFAITQAGTPLGELTENGQVTKQVLGQPITAVSSLTNRNVFSFYSVPGVTFTATAPTGAIAGATAAGVYTRGTPGIPSILAVRNVKFTDKVSGVVLAQNDLNGAALIGQNITSYTPPAGQIGFSDYDGGVESVFATTGAGQAGAVPQTVNTNNVSWFSGIYAPSSHYTVEADIVCLQTPSNSNAGSVGVALVGPPGGQGTYFGNGDIARISYYGPGASAWSLSIDAKNNLLADTPGGDLTTIPINAMAAGEVSHLILDDNAGALTTTLTPGNQQL